MPSNSATAPAFSFIIDLKVRAAAGSFQAGMPTCSIIWRTL
jgi:hypothetical protein